MATTMYLRPRGSVTYGSFLGHKANNQKATASYWAHQDLSTSAGASAIALTVNSESGPTGGLEIIDGATSLPIEFISEPLAAAVTISGTISFNFYASESNMSANASVACRIDKVSGADLSITTIYNGKDDAELGTTIAEMTWTASPTSTAFSKGDRIRVIVYFDDAGSNMGAGYTLTLRYNFNDANTADSWIQFTEDLTFMSPSAGTVIYPIDTASDVSDSNVNKVMWTSRGT